MRRILGMFAAIALPVAAAAQSLAPITATPLMPPSVQYPAPQQAPQMVQPPSDQSQTPPQTQMAAPADQTQAQPPTDQSQPQPSTAQPQTAPAAPPSTPQPMQLTWLPQAGVTLQVLDKVNAQNSILTIKVGQQAKVGSLSIQVQACDTHPADQPKDSAAYLTITDSHPDAPGFSGWILANDPSASMLQHPIYDVRVVGCQV
jgi:hypothetical protein